MKKILLATLALSTIAATSAMAAPRYQATSAANAAFAAFARAGNAAVIQDGVVIGQDPDGYVRFELLRIAASPNQG